MSLITIIDGKFYLGYGRHEVRVMTRDGIKGLRARRDLEDHSPTGFSWGYNGSGPAQLALAILADALGDDERALRLHQPFKFELIGSLPECWVLDHERVVITALNVEEEMQQRRASETAS